MDEKGGITFFRRKFLVSQCRKNSWASLQCFRKFGVSKNFMHNRGYHNFPSKIFCLTVPKNSHCVEIFHWRTLWCFRKILLSKIFLHRRGGASRFCRKILFHRTETKSFVKELFCFPEIFWYQKKFKDKRVRGGLSLFSVEIFMSHSAENFREGILLFLRKFLISKTFMDEKAGFHVFPSKNFGLTVPKNFIGEPFCVSLISDIERFYASESYVTILSRNFFVSQCGKIS